MLCDRLSGARARHAGMSYIFEQRESVRRVELITEQGAARPDWALAFPVPVCDWTVESEWMESGSRSLVVWFVCTRSAI